MKKPRRQHSGNMKILFFYFIIFPAFFLLCENTVHAGTWIAAGTDHTVALKQDGTVWAWGYNGNGQLGDGTQTDRNTPVQVSGLSTNVTTIAAGGYFTAALKQDGTVWVWGGNSHGQLGDGTQTERDTPVQVSGLSDVTAIAAGEYHTVVLKQDGTVWACGANYLGQLGDGTQAERHTPVQVSGLSDVTAIAAGAFHTVALKQDGTVWAWGYNGNGQLGDGTQIDRHAPVQVSGLSSVTAIAAGYHHTIVLKQDGTVWAWGWNSNGQLGDGTQTESHAPVQVSGLSTNVTAIMAGGYFTVALKQDAMVWAWGANSNGQLGDGTQTESHAPVNVSGLSDVTAIAAGYYHTVALKQDGMVWVWGWNSNGQLGDGTTTDSPLPVESGNINLFLCTYSFSPSNYGYSDQGGSGSINVNPSGGSCNWTAESSDSWISVTSGSSGTGNGTVAYSVSPNATGSARTGKISIGNQDIFILQAQSTFADDPNDSFTPYIYAIYTKGITTGCGGGNYCPSVVVSRGQMAAFIIRSIYGENFSYTTAPYFSDVPDTHGFFKYVQKMKDTGLTTVDGTYMVDNGVTRGQMAAFIIRAKYGESFTYTTTPYFTDVPDTHGFFKYVQKMKDTGITAVTGTYNVDGLVTRGQMAAFLSRAFLGMDDRTVISMATPYNSSSDIESINEAFSSSSNAPWGFAHNGIDFSPNGNFKPFQAVFSGVVNRVRLWQNNLTGNWQVNIEINYNSTYSAEYAFETFSTDSVDGETQLANISVSVGQTLSQGDIIGKLYTVGSGAHVHFSLMQNWIGICPESYFTQEARDSILNIIHSVHPSWNMCY